jgi:hypothetical protein
MSVPTLTSPYRIGVSPAFVSANAGTTSTKIYGRLPAAPLYSNAFWDIWPGACTPSKPQSVRALPTVSFSLAVVSDNAQDTMTSGSGAWQVTVNYLDSLLANQIVTASLNGQTAVAITTATGCLRINSAYISQVGNSGGNAGNVYLYDSSATVTGGVPQTAAKIYDVIPYDSVAGGWNADGLGMYTVPAGYQAQILHVTTGVTNGNATAYNARVRVGAAIYSGAPGSGTLSPFQYAVIAGPGTSTPNDDLHSELPDILPQGSELRFQGMSSTAGAEVIVIAEILLIPAVPSTSQGTE